MTDSCYICLCVFNNEIGLPRVLRNIDILRESNIFQKITVLVFYDTSQDASLQILQQYQTTILSQLDPMFYMEIHNELRPLRNVRTERIARARNGLIHMIRRQSQQPNYFIMMDSNDYSCVGTIKPETIRAVIQRQHEWDSISFDREDGYYDHWALSYNPFIYSFFHFSDYEKAVMVLRADFEKLMARWKETSPNEFIPVYSAFNGFAIYKTHIFLDCTYSGKIDMALFSGNAIREQMRRIGGSIKNVFTGDCEHRHFHLEAIKKNHARIRISQLTAFEPTNAKKSIP